MLRKLLLLALLCATSAFAQTPIPDTAAGRALSAWLDAFNSNDQAKIDAYIKNFDPTETSDNMHAFRSQTGGFDLVSIESSQPLQIRFRVKEKDSPTVALGDILLKPAEPHNLANFGLRAIPPGAVVEDIKLDAALRQQVIDGVASNLKEFYVYPDVAQKMEDAIRAHQKAGNYDAITDGNAFADQLTKDLEDVSHDKHLHVNYDPFKRPGGDKQGPTPEDEARFRKQIERDNCGFRKVEILPGNIGYLKFDMFGDPSICGPTVTAAMGFLAHTDALIFDLRENRGGDPAMVAYIASYLFDHSTHLSDIYNRKEDSTTQYWTLPYVPGTRLPDAPVYILT